MWSPIGSSDKNGYAHSDKDCSFECAALNIFGIVVLVIGGIITLTGMYYVYKSINKKTKRYSRANTRSKRKVGCDCCYVTV